MYLSPVQSSPVWSSPVQSGPVQSSPLRSGHLQERGAPASTRAVTRRALREELGSGLLVDGVQGGGMEVLMSLFEIKAR